MSRLKLTGCLTFWALACHGADPLALPEGRIVDLSYAFDAETVFWPTEEGFILEPGFAGVTEQGYWYAANRFRSAEHGGTHVDAPIHFARHGQPVDEIPLDRLMGEAVLIDVSDRCRNDPDYRIARDDLLEWERREGAIPQAAIVLLRTGYGAHWPDRRRYLGTDERGAEAVAKLRFPGLHPDAARWLVEARAVKAVGLDTASIDRGSSRRFETHGVLAAHDVPIFENLANLDVLPARGFLTIALPMKIRGGSGGPLRIVALAP